MKQKSFHKYPRWESDIDKMTKSYKDWKNIERLENKARSSIPLADRVIKDQNNEVLPKHNVRLIYLTKVGPAWAKVRNRADWQKLDGFKALDHALGKMHLAVLEKEMP